MSSTGEEVRIACGRELNRIARGDDGKLALIEFVNSGTAATSLTDATRLASTQFHFQKFQGYRVRINSGSRDGDLVIATTVVPSTGVLSVSPSFSGALANNDTGELWNPKIIETPDILDQGRDEALTTVCIGKMLLPLTHAADGDFTSSGVTSWTDANATSSKTTKSGIEAFSERVLRVLNSGSSGYTGQTLNAVGDEQWFFQMLAQADVGTAQFTVQDLTNSAAITLSANPRTTWAGEAFNVIRGTLTIPSSCEQISVRHGGSGASDDTYWANVTIYPVQARTFVLPSHITARSQVGTFYEVRGDTWPEQEIVPLTRQPDVFEQNNARVRVHFADGVGQRAIFYEKIGHYSALQTTYNTAAGRVTGDAASTNCPLEYIKWATLNQVFGGRFERELLDAQREHGPQVPVVMRFARSRGGWA